MTQAESCSCGFLFGDDDVFCGACGTARSAFFAHASGETPSVMTNATRHLCAAAYLDKEFAGRVTGELLGTRRAVVPSRGFDAVPVVLHSRKARRLRLARDAGLSIFSLPWLVAFSWLFVLVAVFMLWLSIWCGSRLRRISLIVKVTAALVPLAIGVLSVFAAIASAVGGLANGDSSSYTYGYSEYQSAPPGGPVSDLYFFIANIRLLLFLCLVVCLLVILAYYWWRNLILRNELARGAQTPSVQSSGLMGLRLKDIGSAQYGNLAIYSGKDPFIGTGSTPLGWRAADSLGGSDEHAWSIAIELNHKDAVSQPGHGPAGSGVAEKREVRVDAVEVHRILKERASQLADERLPVNERVSDVSVDDYVVGEGRFPLSIPLVDPVIRVPYSRVNPEAVEALHRTPQAGLRSYQRISISDRGQRVLFDGRSVIEAVDQDVIVSAFVHVAVEGGMFYLQFVPTSLAPVDDAFRVVDYMSSLPAGSFAAKVVADAARNAISDVVMAPIGLCRTLLQMRKERRGAQPGAAYGDIGANLSIRELGAQAHPRTYIQQLDVAKYAQILERLVLETVLDYLESQEADTSSYRASAQAIYNNGVIVGGNVQGSTLNVKGGDRHDRHAQRA